MFPNRTHNLLLLKMLPSEYFSLGATPTLHSSEFSLFFNNPMLVVKPNTTERRERENMNTNLQRPGLGKNLLLCTTMASVYPCDSVGYQFTWQCRWQSLVCSDNVTFAKAEAIELIPVHKMTTKAIQVWTFLRMKGEAIYIAWHALYHRL